MKESLDQIFLWMPVLIEATGTTLTLTITSVCTALVLGVFLALGKISKNPLISKPATAYVFFFRGTPLLLQLFIVYFGLPLIDDSFTMGRFTAAYVTFSLNIAAYLAEIIRAAIQSIDKGQLEAARSLGLSYGQAMRLVIIPQSYRRMIPPVCNEFIMVLKDTALVSIIALNDLTFQARMISSNRASALVFIPTLAIYLVLTGVFTYVFNRLEKKYSLYE
ncbi:MAG: amino acid ABC transporter permease [Clostridiales bacterium]|nr:amino acid ABC transporter permease [Clostridiales bacterium]